MNDQELVEKFLNGQTTAFNALTYRWQKKIYHFAWRLTFSTENAQEICQETFIRAYKNLHRLQDREKFSTWLYQIALNLSRDRHKGKKRWFVSIQELLTEHPEIQALPKPLWADEKEQPDQRALQRETSELIQNALAQLPQEQRVVVIMKHYQGFKFDEIAEILQEPVNTVKSRMYYGLKAMRKVLEKTEHFQE
jgi:RNA polymerase sigma-70 factor, ECF subfamily